MDLENWLEKLTTPMKSVVITDQQKIITFCVICCVFKILLLTLLFKICRQTPGKKRLGIRSVEDITDRKDMLNEIHYSACRACWNGCTDLAAYMLRNGADINAKTVAGDSAFYLAVYNIAKTESRNFNLLRMLLANGADINGCKKRGFTPLHVAASKGHSGLVRWLLMNGSNPLPKTSQLTPKDIAVAFGHKKTASILNIEVADSDLSYQESDFILNTYFDK